jgi:hypothetical protein
MLVVVVMVMVMASLLSAVQRRTMRACLSLRPWPLRRPHSLPSPLHKSLMTCHCPMPRLLQRAQLRMRP